MTPVMLEFQCKEEKVIHSTMDESKLPDTTPEEKALLIREALEEFRQDDPERAELVELKFFGGLTSQEVATRLGVTERTVERHWAFAKARLFQAINREL